tara:strand:+ start:2682 stop:2828 length:147 start_codon:yes stop_codon:yes gene_type:complete
MIYKELLVPRLNRPTRKDTAKVIKANIPKSLGANLLVKKGRIRNDIDF